MFFHGGDRVFKIKSLYDAEKLVLGSTIMGTGGGGKSRNRIKDFEGDN